MDHRFDDEERPRRHERELTLNTGAILGIFLALAVLCGGFFGFGYNMGRKSAPKPLTLAEVPTTDSSLAATGSTAKPAAGSPLDSSADSPTPPLAAKPARRTVAPPREQSAPDTDAAVETRPALRVSAPAVAPAPIVRQPTPVSPAALNPSAAPATPAATGSFMVQVAAVSHQEDADLLVNALRTRGYGVTAHTSAGDKFIRVQVGPFHDKKEADAMRQRLLADGYNAIVKQ